MQFRKLRHNRAIIITNCAKATMSSTIDLLKSIQTSGSGLTLAELLTRHPEIARRTAQRQIAKLIESGQVNAQGEGRARRYFGAVTQIDVATSAPGSDNHFPFFISP